MEIKKGIINITKIQKQDEIKNKIKEFEYKKKRCLKKQLYNKLNKLYSIS